MLYTFRCRKCKKISQFQLQMEQARPAECPFLVEEETEGEMPELVDLRLRPCGGKLVRVFDRPFVIYRGSGFYSTDKVLYDPIDPDDEDD